MMLAKLSTHVPSVWASWWEVILKLLALLALLAVGIVWSSAIG
ncbi:MAG TPA: hypothetical protein VMG11_08395 [Steroidobacteraceae bacterium]|nr:hypothetical protein [Steroidobacteraceae bacterium]